MYYLLDLISDSENGMDIFKPGATLAPSFKTNSLRV